MLLFRVTDGKKVLLSLVPLVLAVQHTWTDHATPCRVLSIQMDLGSVRSTTQHTSYGHTSAGCDMTKEGLLHKCPVTIHIVAYMLLISLS